VPRARRALTPSGAAARPAPGCRGPPCAPLPPGVSRLPAARGPAVVRSAGPLPGSKFGRLVSTLAPPGPLMPPTSGWPAPAGPAGFGGGGVYRIGAGGRVILKVLARVGRAAWGGFCRFFLSRLAPPPFPPSSALAPSRGCLPAP